MSSTTCLNGTAKIVRMIAPVGQFLGLMPVLRIFSKQELLETLEVAGFDIGYQWHPGDDKAVFIIAIKPLCKEEKAS